MVPLMIIYKSRPFLLVGQSSYFFENAEIFCKEKFITAHLFEPVRLQVYFIRVLIFSSLKRIKVKCVRLFLNIVVENTLSVRLH